MYLFICRGKSPHFSHSATKVTRDDTCPICGADTQLILESPEEKGRLAKEHKLSDLQLFELAADLKKRGYNEASIAHILQLEVTELRLLRNRMQVDIGKYTRTRSAELKSEGKSNLEIARELGLNESTVRSILESRRSGHGNN